MNTVENINESKSATLEDEVYQLESTKGLRFSFGRGVISSEITLMKDKLNLDFRPKKLNRYNEIKYSDIAGVNMTKKWSWDSIFWTVISCFTLVLPVIFLWTGVNYKINIQLKNGDCIVVYHRFKARAIEFQQALEERVKQSGQ